jgi:hypothetical protein
MHQLSNVVYDLSAETSHGVVDLPAADPVDVLPVREAGAWRIKHHRLMLRLSVAALCLTFLLEVLPDGQRVAVRGFSTYPLPETCGAKLLWGGECPGCGLTRSFIWASRGQWERSLAANRLGLLMLAACVAQIPYRITMIRSSERDGRNSGRWAGYFGAALIALLIGNWVLKVLGV